MTGSLKRALAIMMITIFSAMLVALPYVAYIGKQVRGMDDDFCPKGGYWQDYFGIKVGASSVVLVDTSNAIPHADGDTAIVRVEEWIRRFPPFQRISIRDLPKTSEADSQFLAGPWCVSWSKGNAPELFTGGLVAERNFKKKFLATVKAELVKAVNLDEADNSPILETLADIKTGGAESVFLISDMLQHTSIEKHYAPAFLCESECPDVRGLAVEVYLICRDGIRYPAKHRQIWENHIGGKIKWHSAAECVGA